MWPIQTTLGCSLWHIPHFFLFISRMKPKSSPLCFSLQRSVDLICNLREEKNLSAERRKQWCSYGGQLKPNAWDNCSSEKKKSIKQTRRSVRENLYFDSQLWDCASNHVHQKGDVFHAQLPGICFYNATSWKMSRLEQSKRERRQNDSVHILVSPSCSVCFACLDQVSRMCWCPLLWCSLAPSTGRHRSPWHCWGGSCRALPSWSQGFSRRRYSSGC